MSLNHPGPQPGRMSWAEHVINSLGEGPFCEAGEVEVGQLDRSQAVEHGELPGNNRIHGRPVSSA